MNYYPNMFYSVSYHRFLGYGLITETDKARWKSRRARFNPGFHRKYIRRAYLVLI